MQFAENVQGNWQQGPYFIMTMPDPIQERIQELQRALLEHPPYSLDLAPSDFHLFGPALVANVSLMANRLERRCGSG
jgi:hypothetical protein